MKICKRNDDKQEAVLAANKDACTVFGVQVLAHSPNEEYVATI